MSDAEYPAPIGAEGEAEKKFLSWNSADHDTGERRQIPHPFDVAWRRPFEEQHEDGVVYGKQTPPISVMSFKSGRQTTVAAPPNAIETIAA